MLRLAQEFMALSSVKKLTTIWLTVAMMTLSGNAQAEFLSGNALLKQCVNKGENLAQMFCLGYITAVYDASLCPMKVSGWSHAAPEGVEYEQLVRVVVNFMQNNPQHLHYAAPSIVARAFHEAWPCS